MTGFDFWAVQFLNGLAHGTNLMLVTMGLTIIFGILLVVNMAHGSFYMLGGYITYAVIAYTGSFWPALIVAPLLIGGIGMLTEKILIVPVRGGPVITTLLLTFGLSLVLDEMARIVAGSSPLSVAVPEVLSGSVALGSIAYPAYRLFIIAAGIVIAAAVMFFLEHTTLGTVVRAASSDREMLQVMGANTPMLYTLVFALGAGIAALSGVLTAPMMTVYPTMGSMIIIEAFVVLVLGGLGSIRGTIVAALLVGQVNAFGAVFIPQFTPVIIFSLMGLILLVRPRGILNLGRLDDGH